MSNPTANGELDDYLEDLLHDAGVEIVAPPAAVAVEAAALAHADLALAEPPVQAAALPEAAAVPEAATSNAIAAVLSADAIAADFLAEMDADPAFGPPVLAAPSAADIAADFLAEMDADPAFGTAPTAVDLLTADLLAEMDADPAFGWRPHRLPSPHLPRHRNRHPMQRLHRCALHRHLPGCRHCWRPTRPTRSTPNAVPANAAHVGCVCAAANRPMHWNCSRCRKWSCQYRYCRCAAPPARCLAS